MLLSLLLLIYALLCEPTEQFPTPVLTFDQPSPIEGSPVTMICKIGSAPQKPQLQLQFRFEKNGQILQPRSSSSKLHIPIIKKEDSGSYLCEAYAVDQDVAKKSMNTYLNVQRVPVSDVSLEIWPPGGQVMKGDKLIFICSVAEGTGNITFSWYKGAPSLRLETKIQFSQRAEFEVLSARESDTDRYYCAADNGSGSGPSLSGLVSVKVRVPVSRPVLTLKAPQDQTVVGDVVELHCEALGDSPVILYRFYHENITLEKSPGLSGRGVSFNLSLTAEHSGNYSCEVDNGHEVQRSEAVTLNVKASTGGTSDRLTAGVLEGLLGSLVPAAMALLVCCLFRKKIGRCSTRNPQRSFPSPVQQESIHLNSLAPENLQPVYENVNTASGDGVYSLVYEIQQELNSAPIEPPRTCMENQASSDVYAVVRKEDFTDEDYEDAM
ncbi:Fc receptor-like protein 1 isoform X2 [Ochotona curzoniae]|uniref:Fc receptor-like protein 1 isoform X2 n=1 Tax=Ochotona curzoniae TaxID=130825 RepID=UPI001B34CB2A|nr:Fc receptor-like protein 1 isoform X2 [Ochotona curzoniae]